MGAGTPLRVAPTPVPESVLPPPPRRGASEVATPMDNRLSAELQSNRDIWKDGYYEGDPLALLSGSHYKQIGFMSVLHATYLRCIKPYIKPDTVALELGPGRGAWTKALLPAKEVWALDARSAQENGFFEYLGNPSHVKYHQVSDFTCAMLPDDAFDYLFSFGCLCHVSFQGITEYAVNLYPKLRPGSNCFWMIADYARYNDVMRHIDDYSVWRVAAPHSRSRALAPLRYVFSLLKDFEVRRAWNQHSRSLRPPDTDLDPKPGRWFHAGLDRTCAMLEASGYQIVDPDVGTVPRDPIIHFRKP